MQRTADVQRKARHFMRNLLLATIAAIVLLASHPQSRAGVIVDTGSNPNGTPWDFASYQYFGGVFTTMQEYYINTVSAFLNNSNGSTGTVMIQVLSMIGNLPGGILYKQSFTLAGGAPTNWYGLTNLNWNLPSGTYLMAFVPDANIRGAWLGGAPNKLSLYDQASSYYAWLKPSNYLGLGLTITGTPVAAPAAVAVPEPATLAVMGVALTGLGLVRRRRSGTQDQHTRPVTH